MRLLRAISWKLVEYLIHRRFSSVQSISVQELAEWLTQTETAPLLLDARTPDEYKVSHLWNAYLPPVNLNQLEDWSHLTHTTTIVTYCSIGYRSAVLAQQLQAIGYKNVFNLDGSIFAWVNQGYPIYQGTRVVEPVHPFNSFWELLLNPEIPKQQ